ncbi:MAG: hypothetical protein A2023_07155 [Sulfuricurvum sp. GWF2_44_89]|uniref:Uncharacterized protein n=1 Tax=Sulfuricurvum kujiense TaxID=148813 RepID=A0A2D3WC08_9BACT|nr:MULTISPECIES: hypothetical protein [Sulfuricurvum]OHD78255.1 MAG: hypothetical protein A2023_07155 [Sulfuricurvum sp. GWF2_44_89]OHD91562.1 MAG: hypothetical protein A2517_07095 [Sulfuricurvum sp. RIFOXYD12_FULL_44_77]OHD94150.1 MAG: hypothetical protein A2552_01770 [Sulfuricurvum sp. RIFOXYD2_FULL_44_160]DAB38842.1 MAG TPA: hypothetical protein CFH83_03770 [Sulfuricurvum kujiense]
MNKQIKIFDGVSLYWFSRSKDATLDAETKKITTLINGEAYTQKFYVVSKFELFQFTKYLLPVLAIVTNDYSISIKNEVALIMAALTIIVWQRYRLADPKVKIVVALIVTAIVPIIGIPTMTLAFLMKSYMGILTAIVAYEIVLAIAAKEWNFMQKVGINGLPKFFGHYFSCRSEELEKHKTKIAAKIKRNVQIAAALIGFIGLAGLTYSGAESYREHQKHTAYMSEQKQYLDMQAMKHQAEQNGSAQIVIELKKEVLPAATQQLNDTLGITPSFTETKTITYPWDKGYRMGGTWVFRDGKVISERITGRTAQ